MNEVAERLQDVLGDDVTHERSTHVYDTTDSAEDLRHAGVIQQTTSRVTHHAYTASGEEVAYCTYVVYPDEGVGYISDIELDESVRNNGIGSLLRGRVVEELQKDVAKMYSYPTNDVIRHIAAKQGFRSVEDPALSGWFVREC